jgi:hypothetical protein
MQAKAAGASREKHGLECGGADPRQRKTALGQIGWLKGSSKIVVRLEPREGSRAPTLLREVSYRTWKRQLWYSELAQEKPALDQVIEELHLKHQTRRQALHTLARGQRLPGTTGMTGTRLSSSSTVERLTSSPRARIIQP